MPVAVKIESLAYRGYGVGRIGGKVVFVPYAAPGDELEIEITEEKKGFSFGSIVSIIKASPERIEPACPAFTRCGGCHWLNLKYAAQIGWKKDILTGFLRNVPGIGDVKIPVAAADGPLNYRARAQFHVDGRRWGFFKPMSHAVEDIDGCPLLRPEVNALFAELKGLGLPASLHTVEIVLDSLDMECAAIFYVAGGGGFDWKKALIGVSGLKGFEVYDKGRGERRGNKKKKIACSGVMDVRYEAGGIVFTSSATAFSQVNRGQNEKLIEAVLGACKPINESKVVDLYCGAGNFALPLAKAGAKVLGADLSKDSIDRARKNAAGSGLKARFYAAEAANFKRYLEKDGVNVVLLDPPREGGLKAVQAAAGCGADKIVYVSCSPPTLGRDVAFLLTKGYVLKGVSVVDMFPQTYHIESVVTMERA